MNTRLTLLYASALLLTAWSLPGHAMVKKFDCRYHMTLPAELEMPVSNPVETEPVLAERQRQMLVDAAMAERSAPDAVFLQALARAVAGK